MQRKFVTPIILLSLAVALSISISIASYVPIRLSSAGNIKTVSEDPCMIEVYSDVGLTVPMIIVDWGLLNPGSTKTVDCYITNRGNQPVTLNVTTANLNPANVFDQMTFTWNREGYRLDPNSFVQTTLTLTVSFEASIRTFSFDIIINAGGV